MLLVIDVGNTNTVVGVFDGEKLVHDWRVRTVADHTVDEYGMLIYNLYKSSDQLEVCQRHHHLLRRPSHAEYPRAALPEIF